MLSVEFPHLDSQESKCIHVCVLVFVLCWNIAQDDADTACAHYEYCLQPKHMISIYFWPSCFTLFLKPDFNRSVKRLSKHSFSVGTGCKYDKKISVEKSSVFSLVSSFGKIWFIATITCPQILFLHILSLFLRAKSIGKNFTSASHLLPISYELWFGSGSWSIRPAGSGASAQYFFYSH